MTFLARYGYVGLAVEQDEFVAEGLNEAGLVGRAFLFSRLRTVCALRPGPEIEKHRRFATGVVDSRRM